MKSRVTYRVHEVFASHGFQDIETPTFEYFEVFSNEVGTIPSKELYKFFDRDNNTLVLRPDFTPSIARACATCFSPDERVVNLCYTGQAFTNNPGYQGRLKETTQMGVETMGDASPFADAQILAMAVECLKAAGLKDFQLSIGQVDYFKALLAEADLPEQEWGTLRELISQKNYYGVSKLVLAHGVRADLAEAFARLPQLFGGVEVLKEAKTLGGDNKEALKAVERLEEIYELLCAYGVEKYVAFDFGMLSKYQYYTGIIFQAYTYGSGEPLLKGGRYDHLLAHFGKEAAAVGFVIVVDSLVRALQHQGVEAKEEEIVWISFKKEDTLKAIEEAKRLREEGKRVAMELVKEGDA